MPGKSGLHEEVWELSTSIADEDGGKRGVSSRPEITRTEKEGKREQKEQKPREKQKLRSHEKTGLDTIEKTGSHRRIRGAGEEKRITAGVSLIF